MRPLFILHLALMAVFAQWHGPLVAAEAQPSVAARAQAILKTHCHRCHGQKGSVEGGFNYVLDRDMLAARRKLVPGAPEQSPLFKRIVAGKMPPPGEQPRLSHAEIAVLREWIAVGAPAAQANVERPLVKENSQEDWILDDLEAFDRRSRRFIRYFSLAALANAGHGPDELQTYRNALAKLLNSLSWHPRITLPRAVDPAGLLLRIDLRDFQWDANLWNRLLADYPYGILHDTAVARAVLAATATRMPVVRADWFVASASRPPLYYDLLQIPANLADLERQLRVDANLDIQQERVARAGFNGSGISRNNRILERHDAQNGAYWRTYDFDAVPQNLLERDILLPDRRNLFAYPLGPGAADNQFLHAGGEVIFNLPNGLHGFLLVNANNVRIDKAPTAIVSDPKRPDRAVEPAVSCMSCHYRGILPKDDQVRDHVAKNPRAFSRADADLIRALYPPREKMRAHMDDDAERYRLALEKTGNNVSTAEVVGTIAQRYEADVDLPTLAAEAGLRHTDLLGRLQKSAALGRSLGALKAPGAVIARQIVAQAFGDLVRDLRVGAPYQPGLVGQVLPDNTGEVDPLEAQSSRANAAALSPDGRLAAFASADKTVVLWDVAAGRELRRCIGHTASVWCVAFAADGTRLLSGGKDATVRLWDVGTARELARLEGHGDLVTAVAFAPDGKKALSTGLDHEAILWDLENASAVPGFAFRDRARFLNLAAFTPDASQVLLAAGKSLLFLDVRDGKLLRTLEGHSAAVTAAAFTRDGKRLLTGSDDRTLRIWDVNAARTLRVLTGPESWVRSVALSANGKQALSGGSDAAVRWWDMESSKELGRFDKHAESVVAVAFTAGETQALSVGRDAAVHLWILPHRADASPPSQPDGQPMTIESPRSGPAAAKLHTAGVIRVGGTVGPMIVSTDRQNLFYLNRTAHELSRIDLASPARNGVVLKLAEDTETVCLSHDGRTLVAAAPNPRQKPGEAAATRFQLIDPLHMTVRKSFVAPVAAFDLAVADNGLLFASGSSGDWTDIAVIDSASEAIPARWGGVWAQSFVQLAPGQRQLFVSTQGVSPGRLDAFSFFGNLQEKPDFRPVKVPAKFPLGGEFQVTTDGRFLLAKTGTILRTPAEPNEDLVPHAAVEPFLAAAVDPATQAAFLLTANGTLKRLSYPDFQEKAVYPLDFAAYQLALDARRNRIYVAGFDPRTVAENPRARAHGDIRIYDLPRK